MSQETYSVRAKIVVGNASKRIRRLQITFDKSINERIMGKLCTPMLTLNEGLVLKFAEYGRFTLQKSPSSDLIRLNIGDEFLGAISNEELSYDINLTGVWYNVDGSMKLPPVERMAHREWPTNLRTHTEAEPVAITETNPAEVVLDDQIDGVERKLQLLRNELYTLSSQFEQCKTKIEVLSDQRDALKTALHKVREG